MPDTPSANVMASAEEIYNWPRRQTQQVITDAERIRAYADIITRHLGDPEKGLRTAAKWMAETKQEPPCVDDYACPRDGYDGCGQECGIGGVDQYAQCWLEFWRKEAER